ncbi:MAG: glycosyltransferase family 4 protein [Bacteroidales bacterium]|nr:glycosyltransferase family 4 protein [Lachnoclostridium sp.]MCM1384724.1 glycosyltransferase family 4 protein [Lachnoclostridium sp.]MCM1465262.1 glycosyltransferase family 4 protein [Bacteroidales bacterium]
MKQNKIAFFLGGMTRGGAERVISILSKKYASQGWQTDICVLLFYRLDYEIDKTTRFIDLTGGDGQRWKRVPYWINAIRKYVKNEKPDVIVSFVARINALVQLACVGLDVPIVVSERIDPRYDGRELPIRILNNLFYPKAKKVVFQTKRIQSYFNKKIQDNGCIILNPVTVTTYASQKKKKKIVAVGRIMAQKNHKLLIESFSDVVKLYPEYELYIYGDGDLIPQLTELSRNLEIENQVHFPGNKPDIHREIADAEIFVLSSDYEGLSNALMEAMMMGLPCISTDCSGSDEIIANGINGLLVPIGNRESLKNAMIRLIQDNTLKNSLGEAAKKTAENFTVELVMEQWMKVIG